MRALEPLRRLQWQLPLSIAALLLAVVAALSWSAYREVRSSALRAASERMQDAARQFEILLAQSVSLRLAEVRELAGDALLVESVADEAPVPEAVRAAFEDLRASGPQVTVTLWDASGAVLYDGRAPEIEPLPIGRSFPDWAVAEETAVSGFFSHGEVVWFEVAAAVREADRIVGYVVQCRRLAASPRGAQVLTDLVGRGAALLVGTPGGAWTDLVGIVEGPPAAVSDDELPREYRIANRGARLGAGVAVAGTPWEVWVELSRDAVLARPKAFLARVLPLGGLFVLLGAGAGWALSRRVTKGLRELTGAAAAIAEGDLERRVDLRRRDELGELADAFNVMAGRVEDAQHRLEERVLERTAELLASQEQLGAIATTAQEAIVTADAGGVITYFNPGAERAFGYAAEEVLGQPLTLLMPERYHEGHRRGLARYLETGSSSVMGRILELSGRKRDGSEFPIELSLATWHRRDGESAFAGIIRDVTRRRQTEEALARYASDLQAVNQELEAFSYSVSHDLRAPLRSIHGFSQALMEDYRHRLDGDGIDYLERVCAAVDRMGDLIDDLLELSRAARVPMRREVVDLGALARDIAAELGMTAPERAATVSIADDLIVTGDGRLLRLVLQNLLANAWKFTSRETRATIEVGTTVVDGEERLFFVRDNGAGFDMQYADKLFGAFQRLHARSEFPGTGVGLALVQRIVQRHGGRIWAEGSVGSGATFYFTMPGS
jgi:PAS domain S-box-containing protein